jgi:hypothetical protein
MTLRPDFLEALDLLLLRLGARSHRGLGAEAVDELLQMGDLALLVLELRGLLLLAGVLLVEVVVVVAGVFVQRAAAQLEDAVAEDVEEFAVVGNDDQPAGIARQVVLKPEQRLEVEVVGRLVEHEQGGLADEQAREVGAHHPAAGKGVGRLLMVGLAEAETGEDFLCARLERPVDVVIVVVFRDEFLAAGGDVQDGLVAHRGAFLRQIAEVGAAFPLDGPLVGRLLAEDKVEERGLACAVGSDQAEAVRARDEQRHLGKEFPGAVGLGDIG